MQRNILTSAILLLIASSMVQSSKANAGMLRDRLLSTLAEKATLMRLLQTGTPIAGGLPKDVRIGGGGSNPVLRGGPVHPIAGGLPKDTRVGGGGSNPVLRAQPIAGGIPPVISVGSGRTCGTHGKPRKSNSVGIMPVPLPHKPYQNGAQPQAGNLWN